MRNVVIHADGSCQSSQGQYNSGGYAALVIMDNNIHSVVSGGIFNTDSYRMEITAIIEGFNYLGFETKYDVTVYTDCLALVTLVNEGQLERMESKKWLTRKKKPISNSDLFEKLLMIKRIHNCTFHWVPSEEKNAYHDKCHKIARKQSRKLERVIDPNQVSRSDFKYKFLVKPALFGNIEYKRR